MACRFACSFASVFAMTFGFVLAGCGGDSSPPDSASGGSTSTGGGNGTSTGGGTNGGNGTDTGGTNGGAGYACENMPVPDHRITDFAEMTPSGINYDWEQEEDVTLTGGTFVYNGDNSTITATHDAANGSMHITGSVTNYVGFGLWFGPCTDASAFDGVEFTMSGTVGNEGSGAGEGGANGDGGSYAQVVFQVQTSRNYPIDTENQKGQCEGTFSAGCTFNGVEDIEVSGTTQVAWGDLSGGQPIDTVDGTELLGVQWQFNCDTAAAEPCEIDVHIENIEFY